MTTVYSNDFTSTLRRFLERSKDKERLKREVRANVATIEAGGHGDEPSKLAPENRLHVCEGKRFGIVYALVDDAVQLRHLEKIAL